MPVFRYDCKTVMQNGLFSWVIVLLVNAFCY